MTAALRSLDLAIAHADRRTLAEVRRLVVALVGRIEGRLEPACEPEPCPEPFVPLVGRKPTPDERRRFGAALRRIAKEQGIIVIRRPTVAERALLAEIHAGLDPMRPKPGRAAWRRGCEMAALKRCEAKGLVSRSAEQGPWLLTDDGRALFAEETVEERCRKHR